MITFWHEETTRNAPEQGVMHQEHSVEVTAVGAGMGDSESHEEFGIISLFFFFSFLPILVSLPVKQADNSLWPYCFSMRQLLSEKKVRNPPRTQLVTMFWGGCTAIPVLCLANTSQHRPCFLLHVALEKTSSLRLKTDMLTVCTRMIILKIPAKTICPFPRTRLWKNKQFCSY